MANDGDCKGRMVMYMVTDISLRAVSRGYMQLL